MISSGILLLLCVLAVVIFDPFFQYHKPLFGLKAVLTDKEYQCTGSLKTFDYDSVIAGSSVAENYNNGWFDQGFRYVPMGRLRIYAICWTFLLPIRILKMFFIIWTLPHWLPTRKRLIK